MSHPWPGHVVPSRRRLDWLLLGCALLWTSCFDQPVQERLLLSFLDDGQLRIRIAVELHHRGDSHASEALERRLRQLEDQLLQGWDPWSSRFAELEPASESFSWHKEKARLSRLERQALLGDPAQLARFFADTPINSSYQVADGVAELALYPGVSDRATRRERRRMAEVLEQWSETIAVYFQAAEELYRHLERQPERSVPCFGALFEDQAAEKYGSTSPQEDQLLEALGDAMDEVWSVLEVDKQTAHSLEELSRQVYDPFPALVEVELPAPAVESEGFVRQGDRWQVPGLSLWSALTMLEGTWLAPDPLLAFVEHARSSPDESFDAVGFAAEKRTVAPAPDAREVRDALEQWLRPQDVYRVAWPVPVNGTVQ